MPPIYIAQLLASMILGFLFSDYFSGKAEGDRIEKSFRFKVGQYRLHIHHWMWSSVILICCIALRIYDPIALGVIIGAILQGLTYKDRFVIFYKADDFEKIYSKFFLN